METSPRPPETIVPEKEMSNARETATIRGCRLIIAEHIFPVAMRYIFIQPAIAFCPLIAFGVYVQRFERVPLYRAVTIVLTQVEANVATKG